MFIHNLDEQAIGGSQPLTGVARVRSQPVQLQLHAVAPGRVILPVLRFFPVSILQPLLHTHRHLQTTLIRRTSGRRLENFKQSNGLWDIGAHWTAMSLHITQQRYCTSRDLRFCPPECRPDERGGGEGIQITQSSGPPRGKSVI